jgi:P22 coat protein - gene protein 5
MANNLAAFNSEAWSERLVTKLDQINVMLPLVNRNWEGDLRQNKTVHVRTAGNISMGSYSRGATISYQDLTPTNESFTVNDGEYFAFEVDDLDKAQSDVNAMDVYLKRAVVAMNNTVESKLLAVYPSAGVQLGAPNAGTGAILTPVISGGAVTSVTITAAGSGYTTPVTIQFVGGNGNGATATATQSGGAINSVTVTAGGNNYTIAPYVVITTSTAVTLTTSTGTSVNPTDIYPQFCQVRSILSKANVPATTGARWAVVDPDTTSLLLQDTEHFVRAGELGDKVVQYGLIGGEEVARTAAQAPGFVGMVAGFAVYETPHIPRNGSGNKVLLFGDNEAISYAAQITEIEALRLQTTFANAIRGLLLHDTFVAAENSKRLVSLTATP